MGVADITYIRMMEEFVFLAVVLDAVSRRVLGYELDEWELWQTETATWLK